MRSSSRARIPDSAVNSSSITQPYWVPNVSAYSYALGANWTYTPSSAYVNEARFGYTRFTQSFLTADCPGSPGAPNYAAIGVNLINSSPNCGMMGITIATLNGAIGCCSTFPKFYGPDQIYEWADSLSYLKGKHAFKFGGSFDHTVMGDAGTDSHGRGAVTFTTYGKFHVGNGFSQRRLGADRQSAAPRHGQLDVWLLPGRLARNIPRVP